MLDIAPLLQKYTAYISKQKLLRFIQSFKTTLVIYWLERMYSHPQTEYEALSKYCCDMIENTRQCLQSPKKAIYPFWKVSVREFYHSSRLSPKWVFLKANSPLMQLKIKVVNCLQCTWQFHVYTNGHSHQVCDCVNND